MPNKNPEINRATYKRWYERNREKEIARVRVNDRKRRVELRQWLIDKKLLLKCVACGYSNPAALQFHHRDPKEKVISIANAVKGGWSIKKIEEEMEKCDVLCANCHLEEHNFHRFH